MEILKSIWEWTIAPVPLIVALSFYFIPIYWRRYKSNIYTPIYFSIYPLAKLNVPLAAYLGESFIDDYIDDDVAEREKKIIKVKSIFSSVIFVIVIPLLLALVWSFILTEEQFFIATLVVLISVVLRFTSTIRNFNRYTTASSRRGFLSVFYGCVLFVFFYILLRAHIWISPMINSKNYWGIITQFGDFFVIEVMIGVVLVGILIPIIITLVFDKEVRRTNYEQYKKWQQESATAYSEFEQADQEEPSSSSDHSS